MEIDLIDYSKSRISKKTPGAPKFVAALLDRNTRKLWTENLQTKTAGAVTDAYKRLLDQAKGHSLQYRWRRLPGHK